MYFKEGKWRFLSEKQAEEKWGVPSDKFVEFQALCGDTVDNVKGCRWIGPKRAKELLNKYESIEGIIERKDELQPKQREGVEKFDYELALKLVTMINNVPIDINLDDCKIGPTNTNLDRILEYNNVEQFSVLLKETFN